VSHVTVFDCLYRHRYRDEGQFTARIQVPLLTGTAKLPRIMLYQLPPIQSVGGEESR